MFKLFANMFLSNVDPSIKLGPTRLTNGENIFLLHILSKGINYFTQVDISDKLNRQLVLTFPFYLDGGAKSLLKKFPHGDILSIIRIDYFTPRQIVADYERLFKSVTLKNQPLIEGFPDSLIVEFVLDLD